jgi:hypothetical protein
VDFTIESATSDWIVRPELSPLRRYRGWPQAWSCARACSRCSIAVPPVP